jgi:hypothetical protein
MPVFLDGQQNLAALTVPGVYADIILPSPMIVGTPTNIMGLVGVGSWGPVNSMIYCSKVTDAATVLGQPMNRSRDLMSWIEAATQVGGAIGFGCVRVTDGTDTAAAASIGPVAAIAATGAITFTTNPSTSNTLTLGGTAITFVTSGASGNQVNIGNDTAATVASLMSLLQGSVDANIAACTYTLNGLTIQVTNKTAGVSGNSYTLATNVSGVTLSGATLSGGVAATYGMNVTGMYSGIMGNSIQVSIQTGSAASSYMAIVAFPGLPPEQFNNITGTGNALWIAIASAINNGNASRGASKFVTATVGASTSAPTLSTVSTLSGGTDGASGVTDAMTVGQDTLPRTGMYVMRGSRCTDFALCDHATSNQYAAISSFALSELMTPVFATVSGDTITNAITTVTNSGNDTPWAWNIIGDYPKFYDAANGLTRAISPAAFGIGLLGNLSPQQSPLNKPLQGVVATQRSEMGMPYSDTELMLVNTSRLDVILPPSNSSGGSYYSFASGRNGSSNTAANGIEYTRMTNFLMRAAKSQAAGSIVGKLQSIQPNDQTREEAKGLFDGFSAQLASPQVGLGINGQGMIDAWAVQCDLANNPPDLQARGYLFLYWQVRYLNVVRYFVVKFAGGGNVQVTVQSTAPTPAQFAA